jgi:hypothetical protein
MLGAVYLTLIAPLVFVASDKTYDHIRRWRRERAELETLVAGVAKNFAGLEIGLSQAEVKYRKGEPSSVEKSAWTYLESGALIGLFFVGDKLAGIICRANGNYSYGCPSFAGVSTGDSEDEVVERLGAGDRRPISEDGKLRIRFGPENKSQLHVELAQREVVSIALVDHSTKP